jgi:hypothetical protein
VGGLGLELSAAPPVRPVQHVSGHDASYQDEFAE